MAESDIDLKSEQVACVSMLTVNFGFLLIILDKSPDTGALWAAQFLVALSVPALAASSLLVLAWGHKALRFRTCRVIGKVGQMLGVAVLACGFFHLSWLGGLVFLTAVASSVFFMARDIMDAAE